MLDRFSLSSRDLEEIIGLLVSTINRFQSPARLAVVLSLSLLGGCAIQRDQEAARLVAARIHSQMHSRDFAAIYRESATGFKTVDEADFVARMNEICDKLGRFNNLNEITYQTGLDSRVGRTHTLIFDLRGELRRARETLVLIRGENGDMLLWKFGIEPIE